jgi:alpha-tubulin suppressor-like RCC1 family protein
MRHLVVPLIAISTALLGACGQAGVEAPPVDPPAEPVATAFVAIAGGLDHSLAVRADGSVVGWGSDEFGQLTPPSDLGGVIAVAAGRYHSVALRGDGTVVAWGADDLGQASVPAGLDDVVAISASVDHTLALRADGTVVAWGDD